MPRYIDAEPIEQFIANGLNRTPKEEAIGFDAIEILSEIHFAPTADVAPVIHAHWILKDTGLPECSHCGGNCVYMADYCPCCGAKMDEEIDKND